MDIHAWLELSCFFVDVLIFAILVLEYFFGRSDMDLRNEVKKKRTIRRERIERFDSLTTGESK